MVAPTAFGFNAQAAQDNHFMHAGAGGGPAVPGENVGVTQTVLQEFAGLHHQLSEVLPALVPPAVSPDMPMLHMGMSGTGSNRHQTSLGVPADLMLHAVAKSKPLLNTPGPALSMC